jgi:hypothetical protein
VALLARDPEEAAARARRHQLEVSALFAEHYDDLDGAGP